MVFDKAEWWRLVGKWGKCYWKVKERIYLLYNGKKTTLLSVVTWKVKKNVPNELGNLPKEISKQSVEMPSGFILPIRCVVRR